jgi:hypothetical protein
MTYLEQFNAGSIPACPWDSDLLGHVEGDDEALLVAPPGPPPAPPVPAGPPAPAIGDPAGGSAPG